MREILFKAKTKLIVGTYNCGKEDGEWVIGYLYSDVGKWIIRQFEYDRADCVAYEVDPDTICQFTGIVDKNDKKIFEGDIISFSHSRLADGEDETDFMPEYEEYTRNYAVEFVNTYCTYGLRARNKSIHFKLSQATINTHNAKVIGNIYDNPELLNEDTENANHAN